MMLNRRGIALLLVATALLSVTFSSLNAAAIEPEKQPAYANIDISNNTLCGIDTAAFSAVPCTVPAGQRLIIEHVSGSVLLSNSGTSTLAVSLIVIDPALGLNGGAFHTFVATKISPPSSTTEVFAFSTPFKMMLSPGATYYFSPSDSVAVSGYLVKQ